MIDPIEPELPTIDPEDPDAPIPPRRGGPRPAPTRPETWYRNPIVMMTLIVVVGLVLAFLQ